MKNLIKKIFLAIIIISTPAAFAAQKLTGTKYLEASLDFEEIDSYIVRFQSKSSYNLKITNLPESVAKVNLKKSEGETSRILKLNNKKVKVKEGVAKNKVRTRKVKGEAYAGLVDLVTYVYDDEELVPNETYKVRVNVTKPLTCIDEYNPVCGRLSFSESDFIDSSYSNLCYMERYGASLLYEGECVN